MEFDFLFCALPLVWGMNSLNSIGFSISQLESWVHRLDSPYTAHCIHLAVRFIHQWSP